MDLGAYVQIESIDKIAKLNGIDVPRLRGYRLMKDEEPIDLFDGNNIEVSCCEDLCTSNPFWQVNTGCATFDVYTDWLRNFFIDKTADKVRWERIHGWKRKTLKTYIHNTKVAFQKQQDMFNKYVGRPDVLYIHARIGGGNWPMYFDRVLGQPWFLEKIDDAFDSTYCDIYAKIDPKLSEGEGMEEVADER